MVKGKLTWCIGPTSLSDQVKTQTKTGIVWPSRPLTRPLSTKSQWSDKTGQNSGRALTKITANVEGLIPLPRSGANRLDTSVTSPPLTKQNCGQNRHCLAIIVFDPTFINKIPIIGQTGQINDRAPTNFTASVAKRTGLTTKHPTN